MTDPRRRHQRTPREFLRDIIDPAPGQHRPRVTRNGLITLVLAILAVYLTIYYGASRHLPFVSSGRTIQAYFVSAANLQAPDPVRVNGVDVGKVDSVTFDPQTHLALVTMAISRANLSVHADARAYDLWRTLLGGNMYVDLDPGSPSAPPLQAPIPAARTQTQVQFDQLLQPLNESGRTGLRTFIGTFQQGLANQRADIGALNAAPPALEAMAPGLGALTGQRSGDLTRMIEHGASVLRALGRSEGDLAGLVESSAATLATTASERAALGATLTSGPDALQTTFATMASLRRTLRILNPVVASLRPGARELAPASTEADGALQAAVPLLKVARPTLASLRPALANLGAAAAPATTLLDGLQPTLRRALGSLLPWLDHTDSIKLRNYEAIGPTFSVIDSAAQEYSGFGHLLRFQGIGGGERSLGLPCSVYFFDQTSSSLVKCDNISQDLQQLFGGGG